MTELHVCGGIFLSLNKGRNSDSCTMGMKLEDNKAVTENRCSARFHQHVALKVVRFQELEGISGSRKDGELVSNGDSVSGK